MLLILTHSVSFPSYTKVLILMIFDMLLVMDIPTKMILIDHSRNVQRKKEKYGGGPSGVGKMGLSMNLIYIWLCFVYVYDDKTNRSDC